MGKIMKYDIKRFTKLQTFYRLLTQAATANENVDDFDLNSEDPTSVVAFNSLQEMQALRCIALIHFVVNNSETLVEEFVSDIVDCE
jgi:hypothetical protein